MDSGLIYSSFFMTDKSNLLGTIILNQLIKEKFQVRQTETIMNDLNPKWKIFYIPLAELCDNDPAMPLMVSGVVL